MRSAARRGEMFRYGGEDYSVVRMPGDGNCLFHSLAYCLRRGAADLRRQAVRYVAANWGRRFGPVLGAFLRDHVGRPIDTAPRYADYMARHGVFAGDPELCAISEIYGVAIKVFVKRHPGSKPHVYNGRCHDSICLLFSGSPDYGHYDVVLPLRLVEDKGCPQAARRHGDTKAVSTLVAAVDNVFFYTVALSTFLILCVSFLAMQLSLAPLKH
ncbi:hypothetical protein PR048_002515 [Dryococelus australis]|uniref:OTU domain-containing protein n=1 Tax=Dryococelus australis TaxID=614101 RepID=A0ABQ9IKG1_9NEOP|nr:hypothetical protein PR048_002515 [Dryococelus australis]